MAKKVVGYIKLQIPAGKATPAPPVGPALGQHGVNIVEFTKQFNARTADKGDLIIPVVITVMQTEHSVSLRKLRLQPYCLRRRATSSPVPQCRTRQRLRRFPKQRYRRSQR